MKMRGPIITLIVVVLLGGILLLVNLARTPADSNQAATSSVAPVAAPAQAPAAAPPKAADPKAADAPAAPFPGQAKYTGRTEGNNAAIAITVRDNKVSAYLCDGKAIEGWYKGSVTDGKVDAKGKGTNQLTGSLTDGKLSGTVSAEGRSWSYAAAPVSAPAGLYRAKTATGTTGWVKDSNGQVTGLTNDKGAVKPAPPLDPNSAQAIEGGD
ncbi:MAG TPA: hypothetical protein VK735_12915 [Pseudonocardia sp.]|jgi:hypothetical protein|uniref:hypothetical protein n=1 Tax=Pseudonocardia sp. TaxID=60912 RepID=UPI002C9275D0|nr:hypothetical protein [Pseudonocardia sp.]HTF48344.1 hypothetical protein [Pseudonocardia sp.]